MASAGEPAGRSPTDGSQFLIMLHLSIVNYYLIYCSAQVKLVIGMQTAQLRQFHISTKQEQVMKLYFTCPVEKTTFTSDDYSLLKGHHIIESETGEKELQGTVILNSACPLCGRKHQYEVKDVICPLAGGGNAR